MLKISFSLAYSASRGNLILMYKSIKNRSDRFVRTRTNLLKLTIAFYDAQDLTWWLYTSGSDHYGWIKGRRKAVYYRRTYN